MEKKLQISESWTWMHDLPSWQRVVVDHTHQCHPGTSHQPAFAYYRSHCRCCRRQQGWQLVICCNVVRFIKLSYLLESIAAVVAAAGEPMDATSATSAASNSPATSHHDQATLIRPSNMFPARLYTIITIFTLNLVNYLHIK